MSSRREPVFTYLFVAACVLVYFVSLTLPEPLFLELYSSYSVEPARFMVTQNYTSLFTYMFLHLNLQHLLSNAFVLLSVGRTVESELGSAKYGLVLVGSGILSGFAHIVTNPASSLNVIGASGAVFGSIALLLLLMPFKLTPALFIPLPGVIVGLGMLALEVVSLTYAGDVMVAHDVHLFGFVAGMVGAFGIDYSKAMRGLLISVATLIALYFAFNYLEGYAV